MSRKFVDRAVLLQSSEELCEVASIPSIFGNNLRNIKTRLCSQDYTERMSGTSSFLGSFMNRYDKAHLRVLFELAKGSNEYFEANESFYRDHFVHAIDVFLLGNYFILKDKKLRDESRKMVEATAWAYNLPYTWMLLWGLTALFHDLAYLFQKIRSILPIRAEIDTATDPELAFWDEFLKSLSVRERICWI